MRHALAAMATTEEETDMRNVEEAFGGPAEAEDGFDQSIPQRETLTDTEIKIDSTTADLNDFLADEDRRISQRKAWIATILHRKDDRQKQHERAIIEQEELHRHAQAEDDEALKKLGCEVPPDWVRKPQGASGIIYNLTIPEIDPAPKRRGRRPGSKNAKITAPAPTGKRVLSPEHLAAMAAGRALAAMAAGRAKALAAKKRAAKKAAK